MNPALMQLILQVLLKYGPTVAREIILLFQKPAPTMEDWNKVFDLAEKSYDEYVAPVQPPPSP